MKHVIYWLQRENLNKPVPLKACSRFERLCFLMCHYFIQHNISYLLGSHTVKVVQKSSNVLTQQLMSYKSSSFFSQKMCAGDESGLFDKNVLHETDFVDKAHTFLQKKINFF